MKPTFAFALFLAAALLSACGDDSPRLDDRGRSVEGTPEADIESGSPTFNLLNILRATGNRVEVTGKVTRPFFADAKGNSLTVNGGIEIELYEFADKEKLDSAAAQISPDGMTVMGEKVSWPDAPHFYRTDRVLVLYFGSDADNQREFEAAFGPQFAGAR